MGVPIAYNLRSLSRRPGATAMTALGIALTVTVVMFLQMLLAGLDRAFLASGDPLNVMVLRKGSEAEMSSYIVSEQLEVMKTLPGLARDAAGRPLASPEMIVLIVLPRADGTEANVTVRGLTLPGLEVHPAVRLVQGRWFTPGQREVVVSRRITRRFTGAGVGEDIAFGNARWRVVGCFDAGGTAPDSEIWGDYHLMAEAFDRQGGASSMLLRAESPEAVEGIRRAVENDQRLKLDGKRETDYYAGQTDSSGAPIRFVGTVIALIMAVGSCFAAMNTMYAAVAYRSREIATLRVIGFSRASILLCFVLEAVALSLLGAAVGVAAVLPLDGLATGTSNMVTFGEAIFSLTVTSRTVLNAVVFAALLGAVGGFAPAWHASRREILGALRE
ncbi:MAG: ABC transporter permease [Acidobacteria bacterium]|nr:ABC transporter permease [Acidobacteriota bacterium]